MVKIVMLPVVQLCFLLFKSTRARVSDGFDGCLDSFYHNEPPQLYFGLENTYRCLCARNDYFATLYDTSSKIPVYSAYNIREYSVPQKEGTMRQWREEEDLQNNEQAFNVDYKGVGNEKLNRGHLAPRFYFHTIDGRKSTDVLTNIAPQYDKFNQITWFYLEKTVYEASESHCNKIGGESYFLTGVLKSPDTPFSFHNDINIPTHFWTAVCCDTSRLYGSDKLNGWSFAYLAANYNFPIHFIDIYTIEEFLKNWRIKTRYYKIFQDIMVYIYNEAEGIRVNNCLFDPGKANEVIREIVFRNHKDTFSVHIPASYHR